jgi:hypothetical protein
MHGMHFLILGFYVGIKQCNKQVIQFNKMQCNIKREKKTTVCCWRGQIQFLSISLCDKVARVTSEYDKLERHLPLSGCLRKKVILA